MENTARLKTAAFKEGFLAKLASVGMTQRDIPFLFGALALNKKASMWEIPGELIEGFGRLAPAVADALIYQIPGAVAGGAALAGGTLALATSQEGARRQRIADEEIRIRKLISETERANIARGIAPAPHMPHFGGPQG